MSAKDAAILAIVVASGVLLVATLSQGRLKHLLLMLLGAAPRRTPRQIVGGIPRAERDWGMVARVSADGHDVPVELATADVADAGAQVDGDDDDLTVPNDSSELDEVSVPDDAPLRERDDD